MAVKINIVILYDMAKLHGVTTQQSVIWNQYTQFPIYITKLEISFKCFNPAYMLLPHKNVN
jgi:hypothetical protein